MARLAHPEHYCRLVLVVHSCFPAFNAANTMCARANNWATAAATSGKRFGSTIVGCGGQTILTVAGMPWGSTNSIFSWSWLTWLLARGVMGEDWDTAEPHFR